jgi:O-antigen ligase
MRSPSRAFWSPRGADRGARSWSAGLSRRPRSDWASFQPGLGVIALALALPFGSLWTLPPWGANAVDLLVALVVVAWALKGMAARDWRIAMPVPAWPLLAFIWVAALSLTGAPSWREGVPEWFKWAEVAVVYIVGAQILTRRQAWWTAAALLAAGALEAALGAYQFLRQVGPEAFILMGRFMRAYGTFGQPNPYAGYLGYLAPVAVSLAIAGLLEGARRRNGVLWRELPACSVGDHRRDQDERSQGLDARWRRAGRGGGLSRHAILATTIVLVVGGSCWRRSAGWLPENRPGVSGTKLTSGIRPSADEITDANFSVLERIAHWQAGLAMFRDHPWLGVGIGNYAAAYPQYAPPHWYEPLGHAHNIAIHLLAETGILGGLTFLAYWLALAGAAIRAMPGSDPARRAFALGILGTWVYVSIHGLFDVLFVQHMQLNLALLWAGLIALGVAGQTREATVPRSTTRDGMIAVAP